MAQTAQIYRKEAGRIIIDELPIPRGEPLKLELESFVEAVRLGGKPQVPAEGSLAALEVAVAVTEEVAKSEKRLAKFQENPGDEWER